MLVQKLLILTFIFFINGRSLTVDDEDHLPDYHYTFDGDNWVWTGPPDSELYQASIIPHDKSEVCTVVQDYLHRATAKWLIFELCQEV